MLIDIHMGIGEVQDETCVYIIPEDLLFGSLVRCSAMGALPMGGLS